MQLETVERGFRIARKRQWTPVSVSDLKSKPGLSALINSKTGLKDVCTFRMEPESLLI